MPRALKVCSTTSCPNLVTAGRCASCQSRAEQVRGTAAQRGYDSKHRRRFRAAVLRRQPLCVCTDTAHGHGARCLRPSRHADHHPIDRATLVARGLDANDPARGRGLCHPCHSRVTADEQPGGWNLR